MRVCFFFSNVYQSLGNEAKYLKKLINKTYLSPMYIITRGQK